MGCCIAALVAALGSAPRSAEAQTALGVSLSDVEAASAFNALAQECYEAGMWSEMPSDSIMDCTEGEPAAAPRDPAAAGVLMRHKLRFTLIERAGKSRLAVDAWTEIEELGTVIEEPATAEDYLERVQGVLTHVVARLGAHGPPPWAPRYESEQAWHLAAHLRAVSYCDANLASMTAGSVGEELASIGLRALSDDTRDRCEQLYAHLYEWGLARGDDTPTVPEYARYRSLLPAEQRACSGQLAREATCRQ